MWAGAVTGVESTDVGAHEEARLTAVYEDDALDLLELLGVGADYKTGLLRCSVCDRQLLTAGLGAVRKREDGGFQFACERLDCLEKFHSP
jgi:hypothetical protein